MKCPQCGKTHYPSEYDMVLLLKDRLPCPSCIEGHTEVKLNKEQFLKKWSTECCHFPDEGCVKV